MLERIQDIITRVTGIMDYTLTPKTKLNNKDMNISSFTMMKTVKDIMDYLDKNISA